MHNLDCLEYNMLLYLVVYLYIIVFCNMSTLSLFLLFFPLTNDISKQLFKSIVCSLHSCIHLNFSIESQIIILRLTALVNKAAGYFCNLKGKY